MCFFKIDMTYYKSYDSSRQVLLKLEVTTFCGQLSSKKLTIEKNNYKFFIRTSRAIDCYINQIRFSKKKFTFSNLKILNLNNNRYDYIFYRNYMVLTTVLYILIQDIASEISRLKIKLSQRHLNVSMITNELKGGDGLDNYPNNRLRFVENAFQGKPASSANDEEEVFDRNAYKQMYLTGQHPQSMIIEEECYVDTTVEMSRVGTDNGPLDPSIFRTRLRISYISLIAIMVFIVIANVCLLYRVGFSFSTFQLLLISPMTLVVSVTLKHFQFI